MFLVNVRKLGLVAFLCAIMGGQDVKRTITCLVIYRQAA